MYLGMFQSCIVNRAEGMTMNSKMPYDVYVTQETWLNCELQDMMDYVFVAYIERNFHESGLLRKYGEDK